MTKGSRLLVNIPLAFLERMHPLLGEEYPAFLTSLHEPPTTALHLITLKISPDEFKHISPFSLAPIPWCPQGFRVVTRSDRLTPSCVEPQTLASAGDR